VAPPDDRAFIVITKAARVVKGIPVESSIRSFICAVVCGGVFRQRSAPLNLPEKVRLRSREHGVKLMQRSTGVRA
jgi:hypothetical protein